MLPSLGIRTCQTLLRGVGTADADADENGREGAHGSDDGDMELHESRTLPLRIRRS